DDVARVLVRMQKFEPTGIFATGLTDCLRLQAREAGVLDAPFEVFLNNLELLAQGKIDQLARRCKASSEEVRVMLRRIRQFDPKPAETFFGEVEIVNAPDLIAYRGPEGWVVELNKSTLPGITIDEHYAARLKKRVAEQAEQKFTMQALSSARWLKRAMQQRNETTLAIAAEIVRQQTPFLEKGAN
ncbi:MAG: RNA polymerase sigma-54 factor, partial [Pseudomonadota bacterium]|nr:RNA polymerase sigma-54 factor [Pseudomonadota bacterium]